MKATQRSAEAIAQAGQHQAMLIEQSYDAVMTWDWNGPITFWNRGAERLYGFPRAEALGRVCQTLLHTECPEGVGAFVGVLERDGYWEGELEHTTRCGRRITVESRMVLVGQTERPFVLETNRDITERLRIEQELRQTNDQLETRNRERTAERLRQTVDSAPNGMVMINREGKIVLVNTQTERLFGYSRVELLGQPVELLVPDRFRTRHSDDRMMFLANPQARPMGGGRDLYGRRKDGSEFPVEIGLNPIHTEDGIVILSAVVDITERKRANEAVRESEERFRLFMDNSPTVAWVKDDQGRYVYLSKTFEDRFGVRLEDWRGKIDPELWTVELAEEYRKNDRAVLETGNPIEVTEETVCADGSRCYWLNSKFLFRDAAGNRYVGAIGLDITERKGAEAALRRLNDELEQTVHRLSEANHELKARTQENEAFVYSVSHDLRSPMVNLQGFSKQLDRAMQILRADLVESDVPQPVRDRELGVLDGPMAKAIHFIQTAVTRLSGIIDALLRLSRAGQVVYQRRRVDVRAIIERIIDSLRATAEERGATIRTGDLPAVLGDPSAVEQIFANLISNALNYLDRNRPGQIEVGSLGREPNAAGAGWRTYYVRDNGLGITEAGKANVFQPFNRLYPQAAPGEGMGLAIVHRVVERNGGRIWFESVANQGSSFFVALPAFPDEESPAPSISPLSMETGNPPT
jgi:PAS domain S-box-containing protein